MTRSENEVDQIVFRWDSENASGSTGFGPVAWSGPRDEAEALFRISGPMLRASREETRPALIRLQQRAGVMLIRRTPFTDADGGTSVLCHALVGSPALLDPAVCLGLHAWNWEGAAVDVAVARGRLPVVREEVLVPATGRGQGDLDETLPYVTEELTGTVAELLRNPEDRFTVLDERGDTACPVLWGLHSMFGALTDRHWTFASHDTVELPAMRFVFVGRWSGAASPNTGRRRVDPRERSGDRAEEIAARLVRHHLRGVAEGDGGEYAVGSALHEAASARRAPLLLDTAARALDALDRRSGPPPNPRSRPGRDPRYAAAPDPRYLPPRDARQPSAPDARYPSRPDARRAPGSPGSPDRDGSSPLPDRDGDGSSRFPDGRHAPTARDAERPPGRSPVSPDAGYAPTSPDAGRAPASPEPWGGRRESSHEDRPLPDRSRPPIPEPRRPAGPYGEASYGGAPGGADSWAAEVPETPPRPPGRPAGHLPDDRTRTAPDSPAAPAPVTGPAPDPDTASVPDTGPAPGPAPGTGPAPGPESAPPAPVRGHDPYPRPVLPFVGAQWTGPGEGGRLSWARKWWGREREDETGLVHRLPTARDVDEARGFVERAGSRELLAALRRPQVYIVVTLLLGEIARRLPAWEHPLRRELCEVVLGRELWATASPGAERDRSEPPEEQRASNAAELHRWAVRPLLGGGDAPVGTVAALLARLRTSPVPSAREAFWQIVDGDRPGLPDAVWLTLLKEAYGVTRTPYNTSTPYTAPTTHGTASPHGTHHAPPHTASHPGPGSSHPGSSHPGSSHPGPSHPVALPPDDDEAAANGYTRRFLIRTGAVLGLLVGAILVAVALR
ncbi:hypothetical protein ACFXGT_26960 [Streptomyces sp. NPDC059352]|uniref:hypothetical protein n=1 Tax=Streptomyces sp. NPDC059352 TaxID=3346810 RepID=UPI00367B3A43